MRMVRMDTRTVGSSEDIASWARGCLSRYFFCGDGSRRQGDRLRYTAYQPGDEYTKVLYIYKTDKQRYLQIIRH